MKPADINPVERALRSRLKEGKTPESIKPAIAKKKPRGLS